MNRWLSTRSTWLVIPILWAIILTGALIGIACARTFFENPPLRPFTSELPMAVGGSLFVAVVGATRLRRRQRQLDQ